MNMDFRASDSNFLSTLTLIAALVAASGPTQATPNAAETEGVPHTRVAFVTSVTDTGNLSGWDEAGGMTGAAAGDSVCQARASAAGLLNPGDFVAWLSTDTDDAYCRVHGLTGKRSESCGQGTLPDDAGPWVLVDGTPFLPDIGTATSLGTTYYPAMLDELGNLAPANFYHGTDFFGAISFDGNCDNWTDPAESAQIGSRTATTSAWAGGYSSAACNGARGLLCLEAGGSGPALELDPPLGRIAFVTSITGTGDLSTWQPHAGSETGIEAGHAICRSLAAEAELPSADQFYAWLSDDTTNARDLFANDAPWSRLDGVVVAESLADLTDNLLTAPITVDENGDYVIYTPNVWTGTLGDGSADPDHCGGWETEGLQGRKGIPVDAGLNWTRFFATGNCGQVNRLYCLSDAPVELNMSDGFESIP